MASIWQDYTRNYIAQAGVPPSQFTLAYGEEPTDDLAGTVAELGNIVEWIHPGPGVSERRYRDTARRSLATVQEYGRELDPEPIIEREVKPSKLKKWLKGATGKLKRLFDF
jgi:hypothetical protein